MNFNEKLRILRKESGLSQEELSDSLNVSRQAVSKWENGQGFPETDKLIQLSSMFNVSLDYLLKDESSQVSEGESPIENSYYASREAVDGFIMYRKKKSHNIALSVAVLILSTIAILALDNLVGTVLMLLIAAVGIAILIFSGSQFNRYSEMEEKPLIFDGNFLNEFKSTYNQTKKKYLILLIIGIIVIILGIVFATIISELPSAMEDYYLAFFPLFIAVGVYSIIVSASSFETGNIIINNSKHQQEEARGKRYGWMFGIATMIYLFIGFMWNFWHPGWIIFPVTAFIYAAISQKS